MILSGLWWCLMSLVGLCLFLVCVGGAWQFLVVCDSFGWFQLFLIVLVGSWRSLVVLIDSWLFLVVLCGSQWSQVVFGDTFNSLGAPQPQVSSSFQAELPCSMNLGCAMCERNSIIAADTLISQSDDTVTYTLHGILTMCFK